MRKVKDLKGFTLIEILIVIGLIAILAAVTIIALNPTASFASARNSERNTEIAQLFNAINRGVVAGAISQTGIVNTSTAAALPSCNSTTAPSNGVSASFLNITHTITPGYLAQVPTDPSTNNPQYLVCYQVAGGTNLTIYAPVTESGGTLVQLSR